MQNYIKKIFQVLQAFKNKSLLMEKKQTQGFRAKTHILLKYPPKARSSKCLLLLRRNVLFPLSQRAFIFIVIGYWIYDRWYMYYAFRKRFLLIPSIF